MASYCDLEVDVNGEQVFMVDQKIVSSYCGRLSRLFGKSAGSISHFKVIFNDFPGGAESFELMSRFCYNKGRIDLTPFNLCLLHCAAHFMEMDSSVCGNRNLMELTERSLQGVIYWRWSELLSTIKQCQNLLPLANSTGILEKCMDSLVGRMAVSSEPSPSPSTSSTDSSGIRVSFDTRSTESLKTNFSRATWWFEDLSVLSTGLIEMVVKAMVAKKFDHIVISKFLFFYQKSNSFSATPEKKRKVTETVIGMLYILDWSSVSCKSLFGLLWSALSLSIDKCSKKKLESMIGSQMDQANLDNLLIPSPPGMNYLYDVNLVLRFVKAFLDQETKQASPEKLRRVSGLMDLYLAEVSPDPCLKPSKFVALAIALPDSARDSYDDIYRAMDMYLEVHAGLSEDERMQICCSLNYEKLSADTCIHLSQNKKFPSRSVIQALISQQIKLKHLLHDVDIKMPYCLSEVGNKANKNDFNQQIVHYAGRFDQPSDTEKLRTHLQGMQCRVTELEKACRKMQMQMTKMRKSRGSTSHSRARSVPKLCS